MSYEQSGDKENQNKQCQYDLQITQNKNKQVKKSELIQEYTNFFRQIVCEFNLSNYEHKLKNHGITYDKNRKANQKSITILNQSKNCQVVIVGVCFSNFLCEISILNLEQQSTIEKYLPKIGMGSSGNLYFCKADEITRFSIKSILYKNKNSGFIQNNNESTQKKLNNIIFEYCLNKLFSALQIGPYISNYLGFDLIVYKSSVQFAMEYCFPFKNNQMNNLHSSLKLMHSLNIIHGDIKPQNIMWSPNYCKNIFIDFQYSQFLKQKIGEKTFTHYFGTLKYSSPQMRKLIQNRVDYVDLYYNDIHCLKIISTDVVFNFDHKYQYLNNIQINPTFLTFLFNVNLQKYIFNRDVQNVTSHIQKYKNQAILDNTMEMIQEMTYGIKFKVILNMMDQNYFLQEQKIIRLKKYLNRQILQIPINAKKKKKLQSRIQQILDITQASINDMMFIFLFFFGQDITPRKKFMKNIQKQSFMELHPSDQAFWEAYLKYLYNPFVKQHQVLQSFEYIKTKICIQSWDKPQHESLIIFVRARQIKTIVFQKYNIYIDPEQIYADKQNGTCYQKTLRRQNSIKQIIEKEIPHFDLLLKFIHILLQIQQNKPDNKLFENLLESVEAIYDQYNQTQIPYLFSLLKQDISLLAKSRKSCRGTRMIQLLENLYEKYLSSGIPQNTCLCISIQQQINWLLSNCYNRTYVMKKILNFFPNKYKKCFRIKQIIQSFFFDQFMIQILNCTQKIEHKFNWSKLQIILKIFSLTINKQYFLHILNKQFGFLFELIRQNLSQQQVYQAKKAFFKQIKKKIDLQNSQIIIHFRPQLLQLIFRLYNEEQKTYIQKIIHKISESQNNQNKFTTQQFNRYMSVLQKCGLMRYEKYLMLKQRAYFCIQASSKPKHSVSINLFYQIIYQCSHFRDKQMIIRAGKFIYQQLQTYKHATHLKFQDDSYLFAISHYFGSMDEQQSKIYFIFLKEFMQYHFKQNKTLHNILFYYSCLNSIKFYIYSQQINLKKCTNNFLNFFSQLNKEHCSQFSTVYANLIIASQILLGFYYQTKFNNIKSQILTLYKYVSIWVQNCSSFFRQFFSCKLPIYTLKFIQQGILPPLPRRKYKICQLKRLRNKKYSIKQINLIQDLRNLRQINDINGGLETNNYYLINKFIIINKNKQLKINIIISNVQSYFRNTFSLLFNSNLRKQIWIGVNDQQSLLKNFQNGKNNFLS